MTEAVFLDRDGTIIVDGNYISRPDEVVLLPGAAEAITMLHNAKFKLFLFTNQSGVGRGKFPMECVHRCNARMLELISLGPALFTEICIAPESPDQDINYRKPSPRFINESVAKYGLDRSKCWMIGDKTIDAEAGLNAGIKAAVIGREAASHLATVRHYTSLLDFARDIVLEKAYHDKDSA